MKRDIADIIKSVIIIIAVYFLQNAFWPLIRPYVWFLFYPAVFLSCFAGGRYGGYVSSVLSAFLVSVNFIPSSGFLVFVNPKDWASVTVFTLTGFLFAYFVNRYFAVLQESKESLERRIQERTSELQQSEERYKDLVEGSPAVLYIFSTVKGGLYYSQNASEIFSCTVEFLLENPFHWNQSILAEDAEIINSAVSGGQSFSVEYRIRDAQGRVRWIHDRSVSRTVKNNEIIIKGLAVDITERKIAEQSLLEEKKKWHNLLESLPELIWTADPSGNWDFLSSQWVGYTGVSEKDQTGYGWLNQVFEEDRNRVLFSWQTSVETESIFDAEFRIRRYDGMYRWFKTSAVPERQEGKGIIKWFGSSTDIHKIRLLERSVQESEKRFKKIYDTVPVSIWETDWSIILKCIEKWKADGINDFEKFFSENSDETDSLFSTVRLLDVNQWTLNLFDADSKNAVFSQFRKIFGTQEYRKIFLEQLQCIAEEKQVYTSSVKFISFKGAPIDTILAASFPLKNSDSGLVFISIIDNTKYKNVLRELQEKEEELRQSEAIFHQMFTDHTAVKLLNSPETGRIIDANPAAEKFYGYSREDLLNMKMDQIAVFSENAEETGIVTERGYQKHRLSSGRHTDVEVYSAPIIVEGHYLIYSIIHDISDRLRAERERDRLMFELETKNRELESVIYVTSHDLRSPLVNIQGFGENLNRYFTAISNALKSADVPADMKVLLSEKIPKALHFIEMSSAKMDVLISGLLRLSRLGRVQLQFTQTDMNEVLKNILETRAFQIESTYAKVEVQPDLPSCYTDKEQIYQVFSNLLDNAIKYKADDRVLTVTVTGKVLEEKAVYAVSDNGIGIAEKDIGKIWEVFRRIESKSEVKGEGLGLAIVLRIVNRLNGKIWVESVPDSGSTFYMELPRENNTLSGEKNDYIK
ncbi:MAG TPA: PAS domain S-box protein [Leptospiraceae bacterium]|nr:PAS domain S-box protein [Leptospiraceae bacterium]HNM02680.1 PAS domain S-box protein [Leptospiraceae bacterium]HNN03406.1 PAS domain S-box protein [Leptospiraceae bacterium]